MEEYECVTLDSDDEEDSKQRVRENLANSGLVRLVKTRRSGRTWLTVALSGKSRLEGQKESG